MDTYSTAVLVSILVYIAPYQAATGQLLADGSMDWFTGEVLVNLLTPVWMIPAGLLLVWTLKKSYGLGRSKNTS